MSIDHTKNWDAAFEDHCADDIAPRRRRGLGVQVSMILFHPKRRLLPPACLGAPDGFPPTPSGALSPRLAITENTVLELPTLLGPLRAARPPQRAAVSG